jgi:anti-sigma factor ChrR (cupin superfamily)
LFFLLTKSPITLARFFMPKEGWSMSDIFSAAVSDGLVDEFQTVETSDMEWVYGGADGFWLKELYRDPHSDCFTILMKVDADACAGSHAHERTEQIYVIEGTFYDQVREYRAGDFILRPPGTNHTAGSRTGAIVLVTYT